MGQKSWLNNNEKFVPSYFCQQQKILAYIKAFYTLKIYQTIFTLSSLTLKLAIFPIQYLMNLATSNIKT